jgi:hypothetical protein
VYLLRKQVFWVVAPCGWVIPSQLFKEMYSVHLQGRNFVHQTLSWWWTRYVSSKLQEELTHHTAPQFRRSFINSYAEETPNDCYYIKSIFLSVYFIFLIHCVLLMLDWVIRKSERINIVFWDYTASLSFQLRIYFLENLIRYFCLVLA